MIPAITPNKTAFSYHTNFGNNNNEPPKSGDNFIKKNIITPLKNSGKGVHTVASFIIPGLGQFLQDRNDIGLNHIVIHGALTILGQTCLFVKARILGAIGTMAAFGVNLYSAIDAYKHNQK